MSGSAVRQIVAFAVIFASLTVGYELFRGRAVTPGAFVAVGLVTAIYAGIVLIYEKRKNRDD